VHFVGAYPGGLKVDDNHKLALLNIMREIKLVMPQDVYGEGLKDGTLNAGWFAKVSNALGWSFSRTSAPY
jgi:hypothetical protein